MKGTLWHLTTKSALQSILESGLIPSFSQSSLKAVFLSNSEAAAKNYECMKDEDCVLLKVDATKLDTSQLGPDNYELRELLESDDELAEKYGDWSNVPWEDSMMLCNQVAYHAPIPLSAIDFPLLSLLDIVGAGDELVSMKSWLQEDLGNLSVQFDRLPISVVRPQIEECLASYGEFPDEEKRMRKILRKLKSGEAAYPVFIERDDERSFVLEGRHRMVAFFQMGMDTIPVAKVFRTNRETPKPKFR